MSVKFRIRVPVAVGVGADLVRNVDIAVGRELSGVVWVDGLKFGSSCFQALASILAVNGGRRRVDHVSQVGTATRGGGATFGEVAKARCHPTLDLVACHGCFGDHHAHHEHT